tara:strand:- start:4674 stop:5321 length:648 start_codon:yes stop_codon:yes gene_type:complete
MEAKVGVIPNAVGSARFKTGHTVALAAVYGPRLLHPAKLRNPKAGRLRCYYNMMPFSGHGNRVRPGHSRRSQEISLVMEKALAPVVDLSAFPNSVIDVFVEFPQTDAGTRCAAITAASMALADAGIPMKSIVTSVSVGKVEDKVLVDLTYDEEAYSENVADIPMAILPNTGEVTLLQMDGGVTKEQLIEALELGKKASQEVYELQVRSLKEKYGN